MFNTEKSIPDEEKLPRSDSLSSEVKQESSSQESLELKTEFELGLSQDLETVVTAMNSFKKIAEEAETPEQKEKLNSLREKILGTAKRFLKVGRNITLTGFIALGVPLGLEGVKYYGTHPELETTRDERGNVVYVHPDTKTTHILNVLAGRELISLEEASNNFRGILKTRANALGIELPEDFDTYNIDQLDSFLTTVMNEKGFDAKPGEFKDYFYDFQYLERIELPENESQEIYNLVWEIEKESGNPKVRFQTKGPNVFGVALSDEDTYRPHYNPLENTIYLPMDMFVEQDEGYKLLIAELSHAKQLKDDPFGFYFKTASSALRIFSKGGFDMSKLSEAQREEYRTPGSLEHEAHSSIEPELQKKYQKLTKIKGVKGKKN